MDADLTKVMLTGGLSSLGRQGPKRNNGEALFSRETTMPALQLIQQIAARGPQVVDVLTRLDAQVHEVIQEDNGPVDQEFLELTLHGLLRSHGCTAVQ